MCKETNFCLKEAPKPLRKRLLKALVGCFVADIFCLVAAVSCLVANYMAAVGSYDINFQMSIAANVLMLASLVVYLFTVKLKSLLGLALNYLLLLGAFVTRIIVIVLNTETEEGRSEPFWSSGVLLACAAIQLLFLAFATILWRMVPERKWVQKFDLSTKLTAPKQPKKP